MYISKFAYIVAALSEKSFALYWQNLSIGPISRIPYTGMVATKINPSPRSLKLQAVKLLVARATQLLVCHLSSEITTPHLIPVIWYNRRQHQGTALVEKRFKNSCKLEQQTQGEKKQHEYGGK